MAANFHTARVSLTALVAAAAFASEACAQWTEPTLPEVRATGGSIRAGSLDDTASTGSKTDTPLRDLPASVIVVPKETLREQGVMDMNTALYNVSGVQPSMSGGYGYANNYTVRGLAMRFLRDGYPDGTSQNGYWRTMYDVERIEVLKGPGSAVYGSGQPGGSINVLTKAPQARFGAEAGIIAGSFGTRALWVDVTGPLSAGFTARAIVDAERSDGFRGLSRDITEFLPTFRWAIGNDKQLTLDYDHRDLKIKPDNFGIVFDSRAQIAGVSRESRYYSPMNTTDQTIDRLTLSHDWRLSSALTMRTALVNDSRDLHLLRNAGANAGDAAGRMTGRTLRDQTDHARYTTLSNEFVLKTAGRVAHTVLAGVEFNDTNVDTVRTGYNLPNITNILAPVVTETTLAGLAAVASQGYNRTISSSSAALYALDQIAFGEKFKLRAGARVDRLRLRDAGSQGTVAFREIAATKSLASGSLGGGYQPSRTVSFYAGLSSGRFMNLATEANAVALEPESSRQAEAGVKSTLFDNRVDFNFALFETKRNNYYITLPGSLSPTPDGKDRTRGAELDLTARPLRGLSLNANFVVQDPETLSNTLASNTILGVVNRSISGTLPSGVAKRSGRLWAAYEFQEPALRGWGVGLGAIYKGPSYADNLNLYKVPSYTVLDAGLFYRTREWDVALNLRNLTNTTYYTNPTFIGALPGEPRSVLATARIRFD